MTEAKVAPPLVRELEYSERATWGTCGYCGSGHGEWCAPIGPTLGLTANGNPPAQGVHLCRLRAAPTSIRVVGAEDR